MPDHTGQFREFGLSAVTHANASGIESIDMDKINIQLFPNPAKQEVIVAIEMFEFRIAEIKIYRIDGSQVFELNTNERKNYIDVTRFKAGVYIVRIDVDGKTMNKRLIIQ
jgi:hypothetical protein